MFDALDAKDVAILRELDLDARKSLTQIGKKTQLSKEVVHYRIKKLMKENILKGFWATPAIGSESTVHKLLIKNKSLAHHKTEFLNYVASLKGVAWFSTTEGRWDYIITIFTHKNELSSKIYLDIMQQFGSYFSEKHILRSISMIPMNEKYLHSKADIEQYKENNFLEPIPKIDEVDNKIIDLLSEDARFSFREIGQALQLSSEAISKRYKQLINKGLILRTNIRLNHSKLHLTYYHLFIAVTNHSRKNELVGFFEQHPHCVFIMKHIGMYDLHIEIVCEEKNVESIVDELTNAHPQLIARYDLVKVRKEHVMMIKR